MILANAVQNSRFPSSSQNILAWLAQLARNQATRAHLTELTRLAGWANFKAVGTTLKSVSGGVRQVTTRRGRDRGRNPQALR